jgi:subtilisin
MQSLTRLWALALALNLALLQVTAGVGAAPASQGRPDPPDSESVPGQQISAQAIPERYIVVLKPDVADPRRVANEKAQRHGLTVSHVYQNALKGYAARIPAARLDAVRADPRVLLVSEDREVKAFTHSATHEEAPTGLRRIDLAAADTTMPDNQNQRLSNDGAGVAVAVLDTGIDLTHPDLRENINTALGTSCIPGAPTPNDDNGHGTHVAGTIAARDNNTGVVGVAPLATLVPVKVLDSAGSGSWASIICGIDHVTGQASSIKVVNMSLGGGGTDGPCEADALHMAICRSVGAGVTYVVAAGNDGRDFGVASNFFRPQTVPAVYDEVLTVTAMSDFNGQPGGRAPRTCRRDVDDTAADFSNYTTIGSLEARHVVAAPGVCILSTWKGGTYNTISGTSMATPHVAGVAALCIASGQCGLANDPVPEKRPLNKLRADAEARSRDPSVSPYFGFTDDPRSPSGSRYYGYLVYPGGY